MSDNRFLGSLQADDEREPFRALSRQGSGGYVGLETFDNPGCAVVSYTSDELMAKCPITGQPDFYTIEIALKATEKLIESKSLKLYFQLLIEASYQKDFGIFCEAFAVHIRDQIVQALGCEEEDVQVMLRQKSRGGISITAVT